MPEVEIQDAQWGFADLHTRLEGVLRCTIQEMKTDAASLECKFKGFWGTEAKCGLAIEKHKNEFRVTLTELPDNPGTSVTNMVEHLATMVKQQFLHEIPNETITWIEHYPKNERLGHPESFDKVEMLWDDVRYSHPKWQRLKR